MPAPGAYFYLRPEERALLRLRAEPAYAIVLALPGLVISAILLGILLAARALLAPVAVAVPAWVAWAVPLALAAIVAFAAWRRAATTEYALTDERIYARVGRLVTRLHFTTHDKVTDIQYREGPIERAFGLAAITFATAGGEVRVAGVRNALAVKATAETARDAFIKTLLAEAPLATEERADATGAPSAPAASPAPARAPLPPPPEWTGPRPDYLQAGDTPVWAAQPRLAASVAALRSALGLIPILLFSNFMDEGRRAIILVGAVGFVMIMIAVRLMQLRRTEYIATDRRVYARRGLVGTTVSQLTYDKITDITYNQDLLGRVFGYGSVTLQSAGGQQAPITMIGLAYPLQAKEEIERWRDRSLGGGG